MWKTIYARKVGNSSGFGVMSSELQKDDNLYRGAWNQSFVGRHRSSVFHFSRLAFHCAILFLMLSACSTTHQAHSIGIFYGEKALKSGDYEKAKRNFEAAYQIDKTPDALMYLAIVDYKTDKLDSAEKLILEAEIMESTNYHYLRVLGYKALILLKKNSEQGLEDLNRYVAFYAFCDPLMSINDVKKMVQNRNADMQLLEKLIEEQISWFENDIELYWNSGVGYYDGKRSFGGPSRFRGGVIFR